MTFGWRPSFRQLEGASLFVCAVALIISMKQCSDNAGKYATAKDYLSSLNDTIVYLKNGIAQKPAVEITKDLFEQIASENEALKKALKDAKLKAKNVHSYVQVVTKVDIDTILVAFHDTLPCGDFKPIAFSVDSSHYSIAGSVKKTGLTFTTINFPDSLYIITADKKHLFRKDEFLVSVGHSNPLIKTIGLTSLTITEKRKWWRSGWIRGLGGLIGGVYISQKFLK